MKTLLSIIILTLLTACGGGGGGGGGGDDPAPVTPATPVEPIEPIEKSYSLSVLFPSNPTLIPSFQLEGSHSESGDIRGTLSMNKRAAVMLDGIIAFPIEGIITATYIEHNDWTASVTVTSYYDENDYLLSTKNNSTGTVCYPAFLYKLPDTVKKGDLRNFPDLDCSDGSRIRSSWRIVGAATNDDIYYVLDTTIYNDLDNIAYTETQQIRFSLDGKILSYETYVNSFDPVYTMTIKSIETSNIPEVKDGVVSEIDIRGTWNYVISGSNCPGQNEQGTATWTYDFGGYHMSTQTNNGLDSSCNYRGYDSSNDGGDRYIANSPISSSEFIAALNDYDHDFVWDQIVFETTDKITLTGSHRTGSILLTFTR